MDELAPDGFVIEEHEVFIFGICPSCIDPNKAIHPRRRKQHLRA
jgi:hypothetical protein